MHMADEARRALWLALRSKITAYGRVLAIRTLCDLPLQCPALDVLGREVDDLRKMFTSLSIRDLVEGRYSFGVTVYNKSPVATVMGVYVPSTVLRQIVDSSQADRYVARLDFAGGANDSFLISGQTTLRAEFKNLRLRVKPVDGPESAFVVLYTEDETCHGQRLAPFSGKHL